MFLVLKSTPIVLWYTSGNVSSVNLNKQHDFPTPESPINKNFNSWKSPFIMEVVTVPRPVRTVVLLNNALLVSSVGYDTVQKKNDCWYQGWFISSIPERLVRARWRGEVGRNVFLGEEYDSAITQNQKTRKVGYWSTTLSIPVSGCVASPNLWYTSPNLHVSEHNKYINKDQTLTEYGQFSHISKEEIAQFARDYKKTIELLSSNFCFLYYN